MVERAIIEVVESLSTEKEQKRIFVALVHDFLGMVVGQGGGSVFGYVS